MITRFKVLANRIFPYDRHDVRWLILVRVCILLTILLSSLALLFKDEHGLNRLIYIFTPIAVLLGVSLVSALWIKFRGVSRWFTLLQLTTDVFIVTGIVYVTGGAISPFLFLYLPVVMAAAMLVSRNAALCFGFLSTAAYSTLLWLIFNGVLATADGAMHTQLPNGGVILQITGLLSAMILIGVATSYLNGELSKSAELVVRSQKDLSDMSSKQKALEDQLQMQERMARLLAEQHHEPSMSHTTLQEFVGETPIMKKVFDLIGRVAKTDATVLIAGESGTGKELVAKAIHRGSERTKGAFVAVNCGAIPENLIESQLFGHSKGSFTGADADHTGLFRQAEGGTIFLDEIGELPIHMQSKLLRVIQEKKVRPIGSTKDLPINVRIISATNRNLKKEVIAGNFREDLFYRLNVINVQLPPLRERLDDIPLLTNAIVKSIVKSGEPPVISPEVMKILMRYSYPGNVRELENIMERALVLGGRAILPEHLPDHVRVGSNEPTKYTQIIIDEAISLPIDLDELLESIERKYLVAALKETGGAKKNAAHLLGMNFRSIRYRLQKFGLD